jgi:hypothetical protein
MSEPVAIIVTRESAAKIFAAWNKDWLANYPDAPKDPDPTGVREAGAFFQYAVEAGIGTGDS